MRKGLFRDAAGSYPLAAGWAYGDVDWPNGRPDGPSRGMRIGSGVLVDAQGVAAVRLGASPAEFHDPDSD